MRETYYIFCVLNLKCITISSWDSLHVHGRDLENNYNVDLKVSVVQLIKLNYQVYIYKGVDRYKGRVDATFGHMVGNRNMAGLAVVCYDCKKFTASFTQPFSKCSQMKVCSSKST